MEAIRTAPRIGIDQDCLQIVFTQKPAKCPHRRLRPLSVVIRAPRGKARGNRRPRLDWLLIKCFGLVANPAETPGANRSEVPGWRSLKRHEPTKRSQADIDVCWGAGRQAGLNQRLGEARIVVSQNVFKPEPVVALARKKQGQ
jgi:hypothetical protein